MSEFDDLLSQLKRDRARAHLAQFEHIENAVVWLEKYGIKSVSFSRNVTNRNVNPTYDAENKLTIYVGGDGLCLYDNESHIPHIIINGKHINGLDVDRQDEVKEYYNRIVVVIENSLGMSMADLTEGHMGYVV